MAADAAPLRTRPPSTLSLRHGVGIAIVLTGAMILSYQAYGALAGVDPRMKGALLGGMVALFATALGTLPVLFSPQFSQRSYDAMLGFGAVSCSRRARSP